MARYNDTYGDGLGGTRPQQRTIFGVLLFVIMMAITCSASVALIIAYLTPYVSPSTFGSLTIVGIFAPILYITVVICMLVWLIMGRRIIAAAVAVVLIPGLFQISSFYNISLFREADAERGGRSFTLLSYNVHGFSLGSKSRVDDFVEYLSKEPMPDVVCFQEYLRSTDGVERIDSLFGNYHSYETEEYEDLKLVTFSRFPIIDSGSIRTQGTTQWCDVVMYERDTVRIFNNHLYTMSISDDDRKYIDAGSILADGDRMASIIDRIADHSNLRAGHVDTVRRVVDVTPYPHVLCGDFNDTPMSYVYRSISRNLNDAFVEQGRGYGYTFRPMHSILRIDYMLYSDDLECRSFATDTDNELSDHLPLSATFAQKMQQ